MVGVFRISSLIKVAILPFLSSKESFKNNPLFNQNKSNISNNKRKAFMLN